MSIYTADGWRVFYHNCYNTTTTTTNNNNIVYICIFFTCVIAEFLVPVINPQYFPKRETFTQLTLMVPETVRSRFVSDPRWRCGLQNGQTAWLSEHH